MVEQNWALATKGAVATASGFVSGHGPTYANDGNDGTYWQSPTPMAGNWLEIQLAQSRLITRFQLVNSATLAYSPTRYRLEFREDPALPWQFAGEWDKTGTTEAYSIGPYQARYWRFTAVTGLNFGWVMMSCNIYGDEATAPPVPPTMQDVTGMLQWLYDNPYQAVQTYMTATWPQYVPEPWEQFILAGVVTVVAQFQAIMTAIDGISGGSNQEVLDAIDAHDTHLDTRVDGVDTLMLQYYTNIMGRIGTPLSSLVGDLSDAKDAIISNTDAEALTLSTQIGNLAFATPTNVTDGVAAVNANTDAVGDALSSTASLLHQNTRQHVTDQIAAQTVDLQGASPWDMTMLANAIAGVNEDTDAILEALAEPQPEVSGGNQWPGEANVQLHLTVGVTGPTLIEGTMDGALITVEQVPNGQSHQTGAGVTRYKGLGWVAFQADSGDFEEVQQLHLSQQLVRPRDMLQAQALAVYCKPGSSLVVQTYTIT